MRILPAGGPDLVRPPRRARGADSIACAKAAPAFPALRDVDWEPGKPFAARARRGDQRSCSAQATRVSTYVSGSWSCSEWGVCGRET